MMCISSLGMGVGNNVLEVCIRTDCMISLQGLRYPKAAMFSLQTSLLDFCLLCSRFDYVKVVKVSRQTVIVSHKIARAALLAV